MSTQLTPKKQTGNDNVIVPYNTYKQLEEKLKKLQTDYDNLAYSYDLLRSEYMGLYYGYYDDGVDEVC